MLNNENWIIYNSKIKQKWKTRNGQNFNGFELMGTQ